MFAQNKRDLIVTLVLGAAMAAYVMLVYLPGRKNAQRLLREVNATQDMLEAAQRDVGLIPQVQAKLAMVEEYSQQWRKRLAKPDEVVDVFAELSRIATQTGTTTTRFEPRETTVDAELSRTPLHIDGTGSFDQLVKFIRAIDELPNVIWTDRLQLEVDEQSGEDVQFELELVIFGEQLEISE